MALFHLHVTQVKRSAGQSIVTSAAYRAGEKLYSEYYGEVSDYTHKGGVVCTDILLPPQAPAEYQDRATLWNAVEKAERGKKAQLAYSFDIALQNEFSLEENIALARQFVSEQLVGRGMIADFAIHLPDKEDGGIPNPHFHVLCPIRPIEESGKWGFKQRRVYRLDEDGNRIMGEDGKPLFDAVPTTDWGSPETLEHWREAWAAMVNAKFEEKGLMCRIDHRSYARQGLDLLPTVHEGVAVRQMEAKGITTDKGDLNRWVKAARKKELEDLLHLADLYRETKPVYDKWKGIKWKGKREDFEREHEGELRTFHMTRRKLDKHRSLAGKIPVQAWRQELAEIQRKYPAEYEQYTPLRDDLAKLLQVKNCVNTVLRQQEQTRQKRWEMER